MARRLAILLALAALTSSMGAARATVSNTQTCPIVKGIDPDFVTFNGPASVPGDWANHTVSLFASESEAARNLVGLTAVAIQKEHGKPSGRPIAGFANGSHDATVTLSLTGRPGATYLISWVAAFDFGPHACASFMPGHSAFIVTVS